MKYVLKAINAIDDWRIYIGEDKMSIYEKKIIAEAISIMMDHTDHKLMLEKGVN